MPGGSSEPATRRLLAAAFRARSQQWDSLAADHPGSAQLWRDLSLRPGVPHGRSVFEALIRGRARQSSGGEAEWVAVLREFA